MKKVFDYVGANRTMYLGLSTERHCKQKSNGQFKRIRRIWNPYKNYNEGYIDNTGRVRVFLPKCPYAWSNGYTFRSFAMLWYKGILIPKGFNVHHKDGDKMNDKKSNLIVLTHSKHSKLHNKSRIKETERTCNNCRETFMIKSWRLNSKKENRGAFCSQRCYHSYKKSIETRNRTSISLKLAYKKGENYDKSTYFWKRRFYCIPSIRRTCKKQRL